MFRRLTLAEDLVIDAEPAAVWAVFHDLERWPEWNPVCLSSRWMSGKPWEMGSTFEMKLRMAKRPVGFHVEVAETEPPQRVAWVSTVFGITGYRRFLLENLDGRTRVTDVKHFRSRWLPIALFYPRPIIRSMARSWLAALKATVEKGGR